MKFSTAYEGFFKFESNFSRYILETALFNRVLKANFVIFDIEYVSIAYRFNYHNHDYYDKNQIEDLVSKSDLIKSVRNLDYKYISLEDNKNYLVVVLRNSVNTLKLMAVVIIEIEENFNESELDFNMNASHLEELCYHIQITKTNYDRLYYLIDVYTELLMAKDSFMPYHMSNVANWCIKLGVELELTEADQLHLYIAALLHDVGKLFISDSIINKPGKLTEEEFELIKNHPIKGEQVIRSSLFGMDFLHEIPTLIRHHHENYDGSGYPDNLKEEEIPYLSRILKVADAVDAMLSRRSYKEPYSYDELVLELAKFSSIQFDPSIANAMLEVLDNYIDKSDSNILFDSRFIAQASISFYYKDYRNIITCTGNLVMKNDNGHFIIHEGNFPNGHLNNKDIYKSTISFLGLNDFIEYKVNVESVVKEKLYLSTFRFLPTDKLFSIAWDGNVIIKNNKKSSLDASFIKFGGESIVIQVEKKDLLFFENITSDIYHICFNEKIDELLIDVFIKSRVIKYYKTLNNYVFVLRYIDITPSDRDKILRLLFRKQIQLRQMKSKYRKGVN